MSLDNFKYNLQRLKKCDQLWEEMNETDGGRHCAKCQRTIVDFSDMTFAEIALFMSASNKPVCGFYLPSQLAEINRSRYKLPIAVGLSTIIATTASAKYPNPVQDRIEQASTKEISNILNAPETFSKTPIDTFLISGRVAYFDSTTKTNQPLSFASIVIKGTSTGTTTDNSGNFTLYCYSKASTVTIVINSVGFEVYELSGIPLSDHKAINLGTVTLEKMEAELTEFYVTVRKRSALGKFWRKITKPFR